MNGRSVAENACAGDEDAFRVLVRAHRAELRARCHRMLRSTHDAEDAFQEVMLRAWRSLSALEDEQRLGPWLHRIATNVCLDALRVRSKGSHTAIEPHLEKWIDDAATTPEAHYEQREALERTFVAGLDKLTRHQRAVLILRDVFAFSAREVAELLATTVPAVNSALQRARKAASRRVAAPHHRPTPPSFADGQRAAIDRFVEALVMGDVDVLIAMLADDRTGRTAA